MKEWQIPEGKVASVSVGGRVIWQAKTEAEQLTAPTITLDGDTLTITATDERTEEFVIFVDSVEKTTIPRIINFTIDGTSYSAKYGMTWGEWVESEYNTGGFWANIDHVSVGHGTTHSTASRVIYNGNSVLLVDVIQPLAYGIIVGGSGN